MHHWTRNFLAVLVMASVLASGVTDAFAADRVFLGEVYQKPLAESVDVHTVNALKELRHKTASSGKVRVIVGVRAAFAPEGKMSVASVAQQRSEIAHMHSTVLGKIPSLRAKPGKARTFSTIPFMALEVDATELEALAGQAEITSIEEDRLVEPTLTESVPLIGGTAAWNSGYTGAGQVVAILDTGVDKTHPFLAGKVVSEACYSTNDTVAGATSLCPGGVTQSTAVDSGINCDTAISGCFHGTHVAGIAAGNGASFSGVAKDASIIAIKVFTRFNKFATCRSFAPCIAAYTSDINLALEQVYLLRNTYSIAAVNMSLGGGGYIDQASCDAATSSTKTAIDNLRSVNIATVIASGNNGYNNRISEPGCISSAVSVGAASKADVVAFYSNSASFLNLLAPGSSINSSIPGAAYAIASGTSMSTPFVVGAWALLKQQNPSLSVTDALNLLSITGIPLPDAKSGIVTPRIQVDRALNAAPILTYSQETGYGAIGVSPVFGTASMLFTYKAVYTNTSNIAPVSIRVCIDGTCSAMSVDTSAAATLQDGNYANGEQYVYTTALTAGAQSAHSYYFVVSTGAATVTLPASGALSGPSVDNLAISTSTLPDGTQGSAYSATLVASVGTPPYIWSVSALPAGLSIDSATGLISGTPALAGKYSFTVSVSDATGAVFSNVFFITVVQDVDLTVSALSSTAEGGSVNIGGTIILNSTVTNSGTMATSAANIPAYFYLSTDNVITTADTLIGMRTISSMAAGANDSAATTLTIPLTLAPGTYYIGAIVDPNNIQTETNKTNNTRSAVGTITLY